MIDPTLERYVHAIYSGIANTFRGTRILDQPNAYKNMAAFQQNLVHASEYPDDPNTIPILQKGYKIYREYFRIAEQYNEVNADNKLAFNSIEVTFPALIQIISQLQQAHLKQISAGPYKPKYVNGQGRLF